MHIARFSMALGVGAIVVACGSAPFVGTSISGRNPNRLERAALQRAAYELACRPEGLTVGPIGGSGFRVEGCGGYAIYTCLQLQTPGFPVACDPTEVYRGGAAPISAAPPVMVQVIASPVPAAPAGPETAAARAAIDAHAAAILACVEQAAIALDASWDASGVITIGLVGGGGSAEEGCVRAALAVARVDPAGAGGRVRHPIARQ